MTDEEFEEAYTKFLEICDVLIGTLEKGEYYETCEDVFKGIERKHLDVSHIVPPNEYEEFKRHLLNEDCAGVPLGDVPEPKYDLSTGEGRVAYCRDHPDINITF